MIHKRRIDSVHSRRSVGWGYIHNYLNYNICYRTHTHTATSNVDSEQKGEKIIDSL